MRRIPGFSAYQVLREGDILQGVKEVPGVELHSTKDVGVTVSSFPAGQTITLLILREGKPMSVKVLLRNKPLAIVPDGNLDPWLDEQTMAADQYWHNFFGQVLEDNVI
jgi:hypothetical protein